MRIVVCPHASLAEVAAETAARRIVILHSPGREAPPYEGPATLHRAIFHDVAAPRAGLVPPGERDVAAILAFADAGPVLVSCEMGVSRSTAIALALACRACPDRPEAELAAALRRAAPVATPNPLIVAHADRLLARGGRLVAAVAALGRGADWTPLRAFALDLRPVPA